MRKSFEWNEFAGFIVAFILFVFIGIFSYNTIVRYAENEKMTEKTLNIVLKLERFYSLLQDVQRAQRGYTLTGEDSYLQPYRSAVRAIPGAYKELAELVIDSPVQKSRLEKIKVKVDNHIALQEKIIRARRNDGIAAAVTLVNSGKGKRIMDDLHSMIENVEREEKTRLSALNKIAAVSMRQAIFIIVGGNFVAVIFIILTLFILSYNIRRRSHAEAALHESEENFRELFENAKDLIQIVSPERKFLYVNRAWLDTLGYTPEELRGLSLFDVVHPDSQSHCEKIYETVVSRESFQDVEMAFVTKDGRKIDAEGSVNSKFVDGKFVSTRSIFRDVTERERMSENLRLQSTVMKAAANAIIISDRRGNIMWVNPAFTTMTGYTFEEAVGNTMRILKSGKHDASFYKNLWDTILSGKIWRGEMVNKRKDGSLYTEEMTITPVFNEKNKIGHFIAIKQDISERKEIESMKNDFISMVSHELRTPLTSIRGALGLIAGGVAGELPAKAKSMVDIANKNSERLIRLINDILDIEKIESGKMDFRMKEMDLLPLIKQVMQANRAYAEPFGVEFVLKSKLESAWINGDSDKLTQALTNLLSNAAKYSPKNDKVVIFVAKQGGAVHVSVTDRGPGIPEEFQKRIFGKFEQADISDARQKSGTGLGLNITKAVVEKHGGKIAFTTKKGEGTTFYIDLPERREEASAVISEEKPEASSSRILVCEDSQVVAALLAEMLQQGGFATDIAHSAAEARSLLAKNVYAAMTLDIMLPDMDGVSFVRELRGQKQTRDLPIVVVSAIAEQTKKEITGGALAVSDWIDKPTDAEHLIESLKHALDGSAKDGKPRILHIEDDEDVRQIVGEILKGKAEMSYAATLKDSLKQLEQNAFDLVILNIGLSDGSGLSVLPLLNKKNPPVPVLMFSAQEITKDFAPNVSAVLVQSRVSNEQLLSTIQRLIGGKKK